MIVELGPRGAVVPLGVAPALGADAPARDRRSAAAHLRVRGPRPRCLWIIEERAKTFPLEPRGRRESREIGERRVEVEKLDGPAAGLSVPPCARSVDDQGDARRFLEEAHL